MLYPALVKADYQGKPTLSYTQRATAKTEMFLLEGLHPISEEWSDKLDHIVSAVQQHVYEEESSWFAKPTGIKNVDQAMLADEYATEFDRHMGNDN